MPWPLPAQRTVERIETLSNSRMPANLLPDVKRKGNRSQTRLKTVYQTWKAGPEGRGQKTSSALP